MSTDQNLPRAMRYLRSAQDVATMHHNQIFALCPKKVTVSLYYRYKIPEKEEKVLGAKDLLLAFCYL